MQGMMITDGRAEPKSFPPAHLSKRFYKRYAQTLVAVMVPAMIAGMATGIMLKDAKGDVESIHSLAERVEMLRYAETKVPTVSFVPGQEVRTSAVHVPIGDVSELVR